MRAKRERLDADYRRRKAEIRADGSLSWEQKELAIRRLGLEYDERRKRSYAKREEA